MIRKPLRPLARIFSARTAGENPDLIEHANRRERIEMQHERILRKTQRRLFMMGGIFVISFGVIGLRMTALAVSEPIEPKARATAAQILASRADILDRNGRVLATNIDTHSLYAHPRQNPPLAQKKSRPFMTSVSRVCCSVRAKCASIPTVNWPVIFWEVRPLAPRACIPLRSSEWLA